MKEVRALVSLWNKGIETTEITERMNNAFHPIERGIGSIRMKLWKMQQAGQIKRRTAKGQGRKKLSKEDAKTKVIKKYTKKKQIKPYPGTMDREDYIKAMKNWPKDNVMWKPDKKLVQYNLDDSAIKIAEIVEEIRTFLLAKNNQYGDSVLQPIRIFSTADKSEQIKVRIDDKLNRLMQGNASLESDEEVIKDLIGYLILLLIHLRYD